MSGLSLYTELAFLNPTGSPGFLKDKPPRHGKSEEKTRSGNISTSEGKFCTYYVSC